MHIFPGISQSDLGVFALGLLITGLLSGLAAGMLGVGGGIVIVPIFLYLGLVGEHRRLADHLPRGAPGAGVAAGIGGISTMMGIGGGVVGVPVMTLCGVPIHRAVGTASAFGMIISVPGAIAAML